MGLFLITAVGLLGLVSAKTPFQYYHSEIGIPEMSRIEQLEKSMDFNGARIVGGSNMGIAANPHLVGILIDLTDGGRSVCGASMLSNNRAVTAAHCWWDGRDQARRFNLVFGSASLISGGVRRTATSVTPHNNWSTSTLRNDIAMVSFSWVAYTNVIQRISIPSGSMVNDNFNGIWATVSGYGATVGGGQPTQSKQQKTVQVITNAACLESWPGRVGVTQLCAGGGPCNGDSGGPLAFMRSGTRYVIGIASFAGGNCNTRIPTVYTRVTSFVSWINQRL